MTLWIGAGVFALVLVDNLRAIIGNRPAVIPRQPLRAWLVLPRPRLTMEDWNPHGGQMFLPAYVGAALTYGGAWVLFGSHQTFRLGGLLALLAGLVLDMLIVGYLRRPVQQADDPA